MTTDAIVNTANPNLVIKGALMSPKRLGIRSWQSLLGHTKPLVPCETENTSKEQNVPLNILPNRESVITVKTTPDNILVLQNNANTDAFYQEQIGKILDATKPATPPTPGPDPTPNPNPVPASPVKKIRKASLQTRTSIPLSTEEDIDHYLAGLREQLLKLMVDSDGVMIIK